jgi:hypothetical protein
MEEREGKKMGEPDKNLRESNQTKFLAKVPSDWETLSEGERREWSAALGAKLLERFKDPRS